MIEALAGRGSPQFRALDREIKLDHLTERRVEEGRRMALAVAQAQHQEKVRLAVEKYMKWPDADAPSRTVSLAQAQSAYDGS